MDVQPIRTADFYFDWKASGRQGQPRIKEYVDSGKLELTMNVLVIFDTQFGNTEQLARAIAAALPLTISVRVEKADQISGLHTE